MLPYVRGGIPTSIQYQPVSLALDALGNVSKPGQFCQSPVNGQNVFSQMCATSVPLGRSYCSSPLTHTRSVPAFCSSQLASSGVYCSSPVMSTVPASAFCSSPVTNAGIYRSSPLPIDVESPAVCSPLRATSLPCSYDCRQYTPSPITAEMEKFFSYPTMSLTFMPCVCVPDYPVEKGKPRKICRRCSVADGR